MAILGPAVFRATDASKTGFSSTRPWSSLEDGIGGYQLNFRRPNQLLWSYTVPVDTKVEVNSITVKTHVPGLATEGTLFDYARSQGYRRLGEISLVVDASTVATTQLRAHGDWEGISVNLYRTNTMAEVVSWGDGLVVTAGSTIAFSGDVYDQGMSGTVWGQVWRATLFYIDSATTLPATLRGFLRPDANGVQSFILDGGTTEITVDADMTLLSMAVTCDVQSDWVAVAFCNLRLNGEVLVELGNLTGTLKEALIYTLPLWGAELYPGDTLELQGSPWCDAGHSVSVLLNGVETPYASATTYLMRAYNTNLAQHVYWHHTAIDEVGTFSGYNPGDLTDILLISILPG